MAFAFPGWVEDKFVPDAVFGAAYDMQTAEERAYLKTAIARTAAAYGGPDVPATSGVRVMRQGFCLQERVRPADWALIMWDGAYAGPTRVLAAILPAMLAGVPHILACRVMPQPGTASEAAFSPSILAALELAGQELVAELTPEEALTLVTECSANRERGRVVLLGESDYLVPVGREAARCGVPLRRLAHPVRIGIDASSVPQEFAEPPYGVLQPLHPDAHFIPLNGPGEGGLCTVLASDEAAFAHMAHTPLVLTPGHEACWVWPDLCMDFFRMKSLAFCGPEPAVE